MLTRNTIYFVFALLLPFSTNAIAEWQLILSHDSQGRVIKGDKEKLKNLVIAGNPVRILWKVSSDFSHVVNGEFISVIDNEVLAQIRPIYPQNPNLESKHITFRGKLKGQWTAIFSTTGNVEHYLSSQDNSSTNQYPLSWFVNL